MTFRNAIANLKKLKPNMQQKKTFYITSPIFYPNAQAHIGHAYTVTLCDIIRRYHELCGRDTYFLTGTDENTSKVVKAANEAGKDVTEFTDAIVGGFKSFFKSLNISYSQFIRTSDKESHWPGVVAVWKALAAKGDIYKSTYKGLYCVGCEAFLTEKDLVDGKCPYHGTIPDVLEEENYFFKLSKYTDILKTKIESDELRVIPQTRKNEILSLLESGLQDISFSRPTQTIPWGVPVPEDPQQTVYVWCDALVNYISALGYGTHNDDLYKKFWPADYQVVGKDILRFHAAIWPAMLLSAGIPLPKTLMVHGFILSDGKKMSKTLGNVIDPAEFITEYGADAVRYYLGREVSPFEDGDITKEKFKEVYNGSLANGLGNLVSRILKMYIEYEVEVALQNETEVFNDPDFSEYHNHMENMEINKAAEFIWKELKSLDAYIQETQPFKVVKEDKAAAQEIVAYLALRLWDLSVLLKPFLPETFEKIQEALVKKEMPQPLFLRKE